MFIHNATTTAEKSELSFSVLESIHCFIEFIKLEKSAHVWTSFILPSLEGLLLQKLFQLALRTTDQTKYSGSSWDTYTWTSLNLTDYPKKDDVVIERKQSILSSKLQM